MAELTGAHLEGVELGWGYWLQHCAFFVFLLPTLIGPILFPHPEKIPFVLAICLTGLAFVPSRIIGWLGD